MSSVDSRIVNMQFNNKQFESGVSQSKRSLTGLESTLAKTGKSQGLAGMAAGADGVKQKFGAMRIAGIAAVATIASKATLAGINMVKSFTIDPIKQGWDEYNTNLKSVQTIVANTGAKVPVVNGYLQKLNTYSDQTIYNFSEMAKNIGTFTAAGVGLKDSVSAIKGISNVAALSGSSSQQASSAMYQLSQAIAAGRVNLQDWNSVVNAGMGGKNLQKALIQTGVAMGKIDSSSVKMGKNIKIAGQSFRESISAANGGKAWLTSDVLTKTFALMDGRLSKSSIAADHLSWSQKEVNAELAKQQAILKKQGYNEAQIKNLTRMADAAYDSATVVKTLPQLMQVTKEQIGSVWAQAFAQIVGNFNESKALWTGASRSIGDSVMGFGHALTSTLKAWREQGGRDAVIEGFKSGFSTLGKILGTVKSAFRDVFPPDTVSGLANASKGFRNLMQAIEPSAATLKALRSVFGGVFAVLHIGWTIVKGIATAFGAFFSALSSGAGGATGGIMAMVGGVGEAIKKFDEWLTSGNKIVDVFKIIGATAGFIVKPIIAAVGLVVSAFGNLASGQGLDGFMAPFEGAKEKIALFVSALAGGLAQVTAPIGWLSDLFQKIADKADAVVASISPWTSSFSLLGSSSSGLSAKLSGVDAAFDKVKGSGDKIASSFDKVKGKTAGVKDSVGGMFSAFTDGKSKSALTNMSGISKAASESKSRWSTVGHIFQSVGEGIKATFSALGKAASWVKETFGDLFGGMDALDWASMFNAIFTGAMLVTVKKSIDTMVDFKQAFNDVVKGVTGSLSAMQTELKARAIMEIAIAVALLTASIVALSFLDPKQIATGIGAIAVMMGVLTGSLAMLGKVSGSFSMPLIAASMVLLATALTVLAGAVLLFGNMPIDVLAKGLGAMAIGLYVMTGALVGLGLVGPAVIAAGPALLMTAMAMNILAGAVAIFGNMDIKTLAVGLVSMGIAMGIMVGPLALLGVIGPSVAAAGAGLLMAAFAMTTLAGAVFLFGSMDIMTLAVGMGAVAVAMAIMVIPLAALSLMGPSVLAAGAAMVMMATALAMLVPTVLALGSMDTGTLVQGLLGLAGVMLIMVVGLAALAAIAYVAAVPLLILGAALALIGVGMLAFGTGFALMAAAGVAGVAVLVAAFQAFMAMLPQLATQVAAAFVAFVGVIAKAAPRLRQSFGAIFRAFLGTIRDSIPAIVSLLNAMINGGIKVLRNAIPKFINLGFLTIDSFLKAAAKRAPGIIDSVTRLIVTFLNGIAKGLPKIITAGTNVVVKFIQGVGNNLGRVIDAGAKLIIKFVNGLANGINNNVGAMRTAGGRLAMAIVNGMTGGLLGAGISAVRGAAQRVADAIPDKIAKIMGINSPSTVAIYWGKMIGTGLALGIIKTTGYAVGAAVEMANKTIAAGSASVANYEEALRKKQVAANRKQALADATKYTLSKTKDKGKRKALERTRKARQKAANAAKKVAENAAKSVENAIAFRDADDQGKAKIREDQAKNYAATAAKLLSKASAEAAESKRVKKLNPKASRYLAMKAKRDAASAKKYAALAEDRKQQSLDYYEIGVTDRIAALEATRKAEEKLKTDEAELAAADVVGKADILNKRAEANQAMAEAATKKALELIEQAKVLGATNAVEAMKLLDESDKQTELAKQAAEDAKKQKEDAAAILGQNAESESKFEPSAAVLEDAASVVDRWTASLAEASEAAAATQAPINYTQNNYSPVALTASEIYRQNKNLLSLQEVKMGAKPN